MKPWTMLKDRGKRWSSGVNTMAMMSVANSAAAPPAMASCLRVRTVRVGVQ
jgi:hypothetical protein